MFSIFFCIRDQHNEWYVGLAALVCIVSSMAAILLLRYARHSSGAAAARWISGAGLAIGFGVWATHFIAMLGYDPGIVAGYKLDITLLSLAIAIVMLSLSFLTCVAWPNRRGLGFATLLGGGGIAAMHYVGMTALELPADLSWRPGYVMASLLFVLLPLYPALALAAQRRSLKSAVAAGALLTLAIVLLHFTGMTALTLIPSALDERSGVLLSPATMAAAIGTGSLAFLALCISVLAVSWRARDQIHSRERQLDAALANMHQGLCLFDAKGQLVLLNSRFAEIWDLETTACRPGMSLENVARLALESRSGGIVPQERLDNMRLLLEQSLADPESPPIISEFAAGLVISMASRLLPDGGWVTTFEDISDRRKSEREIAHLALHDSLTGLPNRSHFLGWIDAELEQARRFGHRLGVVMIDLDRFKEINDTRGHAAGDEVLRLLAQRLGETIGEAEIVGRLGGDEFAAAKAYGEDAELAEFLARLEECFASPFGADSNSFLLEASLGVSVFPTDGVTGEQILNNADLAMYRAKESYSERLAYYEPGMDEKARARRQVANDLRHAIDRDEFTLLYQPQHDLESGALRGYEALLRWRHGEKGEISPVDFIPIAEETGEIFRIGEWVLRSACLEAQRWPEPLMIAVNLSAVQLLQHDLVELVTRTLLETGLSPRRLELEITETAIISDKARALHFLRQIKALGVSIAMDDFGTGYSSLDTLHSFPFDKIKIDKSFLQKSQSNPEARAIIRAVLALGQSLNVPVLAEGAETEFHIGLLREEGCAQVQGYYFGRPASAPSLRVADEVRVIASIVDARKSAMG